jgi:hypothetical protein
LTDVGAPGLEPRDIQRTLHGYLVSGRNGLADRMGISAHPSLALSRSLQKVGYLLIYTNIP